MVKKSKLFRNLFDPTDLEYEYLDNGSWFPFSTEYLVLRKRRCSEDQEKRIHYKP